MKRFSPLSVGSVLVGCLVAGLAFHQRIGSVWKGTDPHDMVDAYLIQPLPVSEADNNSWKLLIEAGQELDPNKLVAPLQPILKNFGNWRAYTPAEMKEINRVKGKKDVRDKALSAANAHMIPMGRQLEPNPKELAMLGAALDLLAIDSHQTCIAGKASECAEALAKVARVYSACEKSPTYPPYLERLRHFFLKQGIVFQAALRDHDFEEAQLKQMLDALQPFEGTDQGLINAVKAEFTDLQLDFCTDYKQFEAEKHAWGRGIPEIQLEGGNWDPDQSAIALNDWVKEQVANLEAGEQKSTVAWEKLQLYVEPVLYLSSSTKPSSSPTLLDSYDALRHKKKLRLVPNSLGRVALQFSTVHQDLRFWSSVRHRSDWETLRLAIALRAYEKRYGQLPRKQEELLTSHIVDKLPSDPMNGKSLLYDPAKRLVWCVGDNNRDDGGPPNDPGMKIPDAR